MYLSFGRRKGHSMETRPVGDQRSNAAMPPRVRLRLLATVATVATVLPLAVTGAVASAAPPAGVTELAVSFDVVNQARQDVVPGCPDDGGAYTVRGHVTGPADALDADTVDAGSLYIHGHSFGEFLWRYDGVEGYDWVEEMAELGHVSVTYDRLGYETSDKPDGDASCYTTEADIAAQIVDHLRAGTYEVEDGAAPTFDRVALVGHSQGAIDGEYAAHTYGNVDAYVHMSFASVLSDSITRKYAENLLDCRLAPQTANQEEGAPSGYAFRGRTDDDFRSTNFTNVDPRVEADLTARRNVDPCGFPATAVQTAAASNNLSRGRITVPVLVVFGEDDPNFVMPIGAIQQSATYTGSDDVTLETLPASGHTFMLENNAPQARETVSGWLGARGF